MIVKLAIAKIVQRKIATALSVIATKSPLAIAKLAIARTARKKIASAPSAIATRKAKNLPFVSV